MSNVTSIEQLVDVKILEFGQACSKYNVNELNVLKTMLSMARGEILHAMNEVLQFGYTKIDDEFTYHQVINQVASMGGLISNLESKKEIVEYYAEELVPDCFKNKA